MKTPVFVGLVAGGILGIVFLVAILRGGQGAPAPAFPGLPSGQTGPEASAPRVIRGEEGTPALVSPIGSVPHGSLTLTWIPVAGIEEYEAFLHDSQAQRIWRSGRVSGDHVRVPSDILRLLQPGPTYFWYAAGYPPGGEAVRSPDAQFTMKP